MSEAAAAPPANIRSRGYVIATAPARCPACRKHSLVVALLLPPGHEVLADGEDDGSARWESSPCRAFLFYVEHIPAAVRRRMQQLAPAYRYDLSAATRGCYWANHCDACGTLLEDHDIFCEPQGAFMPTDSRAAAAIAFHRVAEPLQAAAAGYAADPQFLGPRAAR